MAERLALPTSDHGVAGSNPAGGEILPEPKRRFIEQSLSCSPVHRLEMTQILLKGCKNDIHHFSNPHTAAPYRSIPTCNPNTHIPYLIILYAVCIIWNPIPLIHVCNYLTNSTDPTHFKHKISHKI